ncbi:MAG: BON domain-containing protein [Limnobacter sp.]|nr:BON domain-containing protein [Limnobacter sp.]
MKKTLIYTLIASGFALASAQAVYAAGISAEAQVNSHESAPTSKPLARDAQQGITAGKGRTDVGQFMDDATITAQVKVAFAQDELVRALNINVETKNGVVILTGDSAREAEIKRAEELALNVEGVKSVENGILAIESSADNSNADSSVGQFFKDTAITTKVKAAYATDDLVSAMHIGVETENGSVILTGEGSSDAEKDRAQEIAMAVEGVKSVKNSIVVKAE